MEATKEFIENFIKQEAQTIYLRRQPNLEAYNEALQKMNDYCVQSLHNKFGMLPLSKLDNKKYYTQWSNKKSPNARHLYKISHFKNDKYSDVYVAYLSERAPMDNMFGYGDCLFITKVNDDFKIIKTYAFGSEMMSKKKFDISLGSEDISFELLSPFVETKRYQKPEDDEGAMEHYQKDI